MRSLPLFARQQCHQLGLTLEQGAWGGVAGMELYLDLPHLPPTCVSGTLSSCSPAEEISVQIKNDQFL